MLIFDEHGPEIPSELHQALEEDRLVIFCGAGVSVRTGLPNFEGLVEKTYDRLNLNPRELNKKAIENQEFDRAFTLLERASPVLVRKAVETVLETPPNPDLDSHKALITLATRRGKKAPRLVTTNFDRLFGDAGVHRDSTDYAPRLPVAAPDRWRSLVHLHGGLGDHSDPDRRNLVLTSADFGAAYLTEGWASRFLIEACRHFTLLFVGYRLEDEVLRTCSTQSQRRGKTTLIRAVVLFCPLSTRQERDGPERMASEGGQAAPVFGK
jgi:hypothetical protein